MKNLKRHDYKGQTILPCTYVSSKRWHLVTYHHTGIMWDEQHSPQFDTLAQAKEEIDYRLSMREAN